MDDELEFVRRYLRKTGRLATLKVLNEGKTTLSFAIQKPPKRKIVNLDDSKPKKQSLSRQSKISEKELPKKEVPKKFKKIAKKFGLPEEHLDFFYEYRECFHWETIGEKKIHCTVRGCDFNVPAKRKALVDHMTNEHAYGNYPCDKPFCQFVGYSTGCIRKHETMFHGEGRRVPSRKYSFPCKYCPFHGKDNHVLEKHLRIHENRLIKCEYCNYTSANEQHTHEHILHHFQVRNHHCSLCETSFITKAGLKNHIRIHLKDFTCISCSESFETRKNYDHHVKSCKVRLSKFC